MFPPMPHRSCCRFGVLKAADSESAETPLPVMADMAVIPWAPCRLWAVKRSMCMLAAWADMPTQDLLPEVLTVVAPRMAQVPANLPVVAVVLPTSV